MYRTLAHIIFTLLITGFVDPVFGQEFNIQASNASSSLEIRIRVSAIGNGIQVSGSSVLVRPDAAGETLALSIAASGVENWSFSGGGGSFYSIGKSGSSAQRVSQRLTFSQSLGSSQAQDWSRPLTISVTKAGEIYTARLPISFDAPEPAPEVEPEPTIPQETSPSQASGRNTDQPSRPVVQEPQTNNEPEADETSAPAEDEEANQEGDDSDSSEVAGDMTDARSDSISADNSHSDESTTVRVNPLDIVTDQPLLVAGALGVLVLIIILARRKNKTSENEEPDVPNAKNAQATQTIPPAEESEEESSLEISFEETAQETSDSLPPVSSYLDHPHFIQLDLTEHWEDTAVPTFLIHRDCVADLDHTIREPINRQKVAESAEDVPEIGGFLLGRYEAINETQYIVSLEHFLPITPSAQNRYTVQFGDQAWVQLEEAFKEHPGLKLVGWFHTHPGHGLFLSAADLREHRALFQSRYQVAMEIDPLTTDLDLAVFTWTQKGDLNNQEVRLSNRWYSFIDHLDRPSRQSLDNPS